MADKLKKKIKRNLKKGDLVEVIAGKDKGRQGALLKVCYDTDKVLVEGLNMVTRTQKPDPNRGQQGGFVKKEAFLHYSNVAIVNPNTNKRDRIGFKMMEDGRKVRICKSDNHVLDQQQGGE